MEPSLIRDGDVVVFAPALKKVDVLNSDSFLAPLAALGPEERLVVLDLRELQFMDSSGLGKILAMIRGLRERGGELRLCGVQPPVMVLFSMVRLGGLVGIDADRAASIKALRSPPADPRGR
jgi:anti-sigma B factor antagonist